MIFFYSLAFSGVYLRLVYKAICVIVCACEARVLTSNTRRMSNPKFSGTTNLWSSWDDDVDVEYDAVDDVRRCWTSSRYRSIMLLLFICCSGCLGAGERSRSATDRIVVCDGYNGILQTCVCYDIECVAVYTVYLARFIWLNTVFIYSCILIFSLFHTLFYVFDKQQTAISELTYFKTNLHNLKIRKCVIKKAEQLSSFTTTLCACTGTG